MNKKMSCLALMALMGLHPLTYAMPPQPVKCPSVESIKTYGLIYSVSTSSAGYTVVSDLNKYDTNDTWVFGFSPIKASTAQQALLIGRQWLDTLYGTPAPVAVASQNIWACLYQTSQGNYGVAITPVPLSAINTSIMGAVHSLK